MAKRTPVGIAECNNMPYSICDDGTLWRWESTDESWTKMFRAIPGTTMGEEEKKKK